MGPVKCAPEEALAGTRIRWRVRGKHALFPCGWTQWRSRDGLGHGVEGEAGSQGRAQGRRRGVATLPRPWGIVEASGRLGVAAVACLCHPAHPRYYQTMRYRRGQWVGRVIA